MRRALHAPHSRGLRPGIKASLAPLRRMEASRVGCDGQLVDLRFVPCKMRPEKVFHFLDELRLVEKMRFCITIAISSARSAFTSWMDGLEPIHEAQERDRKDLLQPRLVPLKPNPDHHRTNDSSAIELTAGRSVRKRARARSRSAQIVENPPRSRSGRLKRPLAPQRRSAAVFCAR